MKLSSILRWPYWTFRQPWQDHVSQFEYLVCIWCRVLELIRPHHCSLFLWTEEVSWNLLTAVSGLGYPTQAGVQANR